MASSSTSGPAGDLNPAPYVTPFVGHNDSEIPDVPVFVLPGPDEVVHTSGGVSFSVFGERSSSLSADQDTHPALSHPVAQAVAWDEGDGDVRWVTPGSDGFCYLRLFNPVYWQEMVNELGYMPSTKDIQVVARLYPEQVSEHPVNFYYHGLSPRNGQLAPDGYHIVYDGRLKPIEVIGLMHGSDDVFVGSLQFVPYGQLRKTSTFGRLLSTRVSAPGKTLRPTAVCWGIKPKSIEAYPEYKDWYKPTMSCLANGEGKTLSASRPAPVVSVKSKGKRIDKNWNAPRFVPTVPVNNHSFSASSSSRFAVLQNEGNLYHGNWVPPPKEVRIPSGRRSAPISLAHKEWQERCLARKIHLSSLGPKKHTRVLADRLVDLSRQLTRAFGSRFVSEKKYYDIATIIPLVMTCPSSGFLVAHDGTSFRVTINRHDSGVAFYFKQYLVAHAGGEDPKDPLSTAYVLDGLLKEQLNDLRATVESDSESDAEVLPFSESRGETGHVKRVAKRVLGINDKEEVDSRNPMGRLIKLNHVLDDVIARSHRENKTTRHANIRARVWKGVALLALRTAQKANEIIGAKAVSTARTSVPCENPWFDKQLIGFKIAARLPGYSIFARDNNFSRFETSGDSESIITVRQYKRFWSTRKRLVFTMKGLARLFFDKPADQKWRFAIAESVGLTLDQAWTYFNRLRIDETSPDVVEDEANTKTELAAMVSTKKGKGSRTLRFDPSNQIRIIPAENKGRKPKMRADSTTSDVEKNPGPGKSHERTYSEVLADFSFSPAEITDVDLSKYRPSSSDGFAIAHPTPGQYRTIMDKKGHRRTATYQAPIQRKTSVAFTDDGSPLSPSKVFVTNATPNTPEQPVALFKLPRSSKNADVEVNPGPSFTSEKVSEAMQQIRTPKTSPDDRGRKPLRDGSVAPSDSSTQPSLSPSVPKNRNRSESRIRRAADKIKNVFSSAKEEIVDDFEAVKALFGFDTDYDGMVNLESTTSSWINNTYQNHSWLMAVVHYVNAIDSTYFHPDFDERSPKVSVGEEDFPEDIDRENSLLIAAMGTYGDRIPLEYFANVAASFGIRTHIKVYKDMSIQDLAALKRGELERLIPEYLDLSYAQYLGYKSSMVPHVDVEPDKGISYSLQPSQKWIRKIKYIGKDEKVKPWSYAVVEIAERLAEVFAPSWRIGALSDCQLPRSYNGRNLLARQAQTGANRVGWLHGSASKEVIPVNVREEFEEITDRDHPKVFRDFSTIHMHGGAGTVQTAIASGANVVIHDINLDRDYHTLPQPKDFRRHSIAAFGGWLLHSGFPVNAPFFVRWYWRMAFYWSIKKTVLAYIAYNAVKAWVIYSYLAKHWVQFAIIFFSVSTTFWKVVCNSNSLAAVLKVVALIAWDLPVFCLLDKDRFLVVLFWLAGLMWPRISQDLITRRRHNTSLIYEPVIRSGINFPFPFGHWAMRDNATGEIYEGRFVTPEQGMGKPFKFMKIKRDLKPGSRAIPIPFSLAAIRKAVNEAEPKPYSSDHNCVTFMVTMVYKRSFVGPVFLSIVCFLIWLALSPPEFLAQVCEFFFPECPLNETPFYRALGFAAGIENIPFEPEEIVQESPPPEPEKDKDVDWSDPESFDALVADLVVLRKNLLYNVGSLDEEDFKEAMERTLDHELEKIELPEETLINIVDMPPYQLHTWAEIVDSLHHAISFVANNRLVDCFIAWLSSISHNVYEFLFPILEALSYFLNMAYKQSRRMMNKLFQEVCKMMDHVWGLEASKRVKTVWGLTGLHRTGMLGMKARLAMNIAFSEFVGRTDFESDYNRLVAETVEVASRYKQIDKSKIGGPQRRPIGYSKPLMTDNEAKLLGFEEGEYSTDKTYSERVESYLKEGVKQGADGVFLADKMPELIAKSQHRYEPKYPELNTDDRQFAKEIAQAMFEQFPEVFANADILPPKAVHNYVKAKYSPGTPFIKPGGFKSRQAMFDAGFDKALHRKATEMLESGKYPVQFYHAFVKSQVVDIQKCLPPELGGVSKDARTVVSQDLSSYFPDQCLQIERNKRINWDTYGAGIGMPLNQSMEVVYSRIADAKKERGGRYIIMDATAFDSICKPFLFEVNGCLWDLGYKDHPSGNGKNLASVLRASYNSRQNAWIIGVTEPEYQSLCIKVADPVLRKQLVLENKNLVTLGSLIDKKKFFAMNESDQVKYIAKMEVPEGKTLITWDRKFKPNTSNWMGEFKYGDIDQAANQFFGHQTFVYKEDNFESLQADVKAIAASNYKLMSNVHYKNRGGSTGGSDTSNVNTHAFKAGVIYAWCKTTGRSPKEFFQYNTIFNTSDDTVWQSGGQFGLNKESDVETFRQHCQDIGINLEIETTKDITQVEYLSKFVRVPTKEDSETLKKWRSQRMAAVAASHKQRGLPVPEKVEQFNNPRFVVVQNPKAILLRRSALRYYQAKFDRWRYVSVERGAGHAMNTAFVPELYEKFALEWCDDVNALLQSQNIHQKYQVKNGRLGLQECQQVDPRYGIQKKKLSPRQLAFLEWLKGNMFPSYYKVIDIHMDVKKIDPELHNKFLRKLEKGWRGWEEILREGVDGLFAVTDAIPDEWSKKFQPGVEMLYADQPFYTKKKIIEKFVYMKLLEESTEKEITFADFSQRIQESPYGGACDPYHFWEKIQDHDYKQEVMNEHMERIQGLVYWITATYMLTSTVETIVMSIPFVGTFYKLILWTFIGLNKVYGILNTMYWHSTGKSSREISRVMPRDPYIVSKQMCVFAVDLIPDHFGYLMVFPILLMQCIPELLEAIGKFWYKGSTLKEPKTLSPTKENPWTAYADDYITQLRNSKTKRAYVAAKTSTGKSTMFVAALWAARRRQGVRKIWLVEPRKVLRDETEIPFGIEVQRLMRGVKSSFSVDIYVLTYGHLQSRIKQGELDKELDIVLFDEFHEQQGEMILGLATVPSPIFLLSATPAEIPSLTGSPFLVPNIDRRHPITVHKYPDSMGIVDAFQMAKNRYPELIDRSLIIVPTHRDVFKTIEALNYLKVGKVSPLTARERKVPTDGIIVSTPYVQTGLDIKPAAKMVIDSGKDIIIDKGRFIHPLPWTSADINQQRIGRCGRLEAGVVFQPESAGTGDRPVMYPSPNLFQHESVAAHFKVPHLSVLSNPVSKDLPFIRIDENKLHNYQARKAVVTIHALALNGVRQVDWQKYYTMKMQKKQLGEDYELVDRVCADPRWSHLPLPDWQTALFHLFREKTVQYGFAGKAKWTLPVTPINGQWQEIEHCPTQKMNFERITEQYAESRSVKFQKTLDKFRSALLDQALHQGPEQYQKTLVAVS